MLTSFARPEQDLVDESAVDGMAAVSVVIPALNEEDGLNAMLDQLVACLDEAEQQFEIIVNVDGGGQFNAYETFRSC